MDQLRKNRFSDEKNPSETPINSKKSTVRESDKIESRRSTTRKKFISSEEEIIPSDDCIEEL
jgi:hypothetical protein